MMKDAWYRKKLKYYRKKPTQMSFYKSAATRGDYIIFYMGRGLEEARLAKLNNKTLRMMFINSNVKDAKQAYKQYVT